MLHGQNGRGNQNRYLLSVIYRLKGRADGNLCFSKSHIPTYQPVHRVRLFHVLLDIVGGNGLIGGIFINERAFKFHLKYAVLGILVSGGVFSFGIQCNKVFGNVLNLTFNLLLFVFPLGRT